MIKNYIGHENQIYGVEELRLVGGRGDGMRLLEVRNGAGLQFTISLDRAADISRLSFKGINYGYFSPCGYVAPQYYDRTESGFLKSFTAGFLTTCGLRNVGSPCVDNGDILPLHGTVSHIPAETFCHYIENNTLHICATIRDAEIFSHALLLEREYVIPFFGDSVTITDKVTNIGSASTPLQMLYHFNTGYPLLSENTVLEIPADEVVARNEHAKGGISDCLKMQKPTRGYEEMCYYHKMSGEVCVRVYNPTVKRGLIMSYDTAQLPCFTEWKMMGERYYVLGIEPGNAYPDGRDVMRAKGMLKMLSPGEEKTHTIKLTFKEE